MTPDIDTLYRVVDHTWPAASVTRAGPWTIREGQGGGQRVSAATVHAPVTAADLPQAETAMRALGQTPLFMVRQGEEALDAMLAARGYDVVDPVNAYAGPVEMLTRDPLPPVTAFTIWEPLAIQRDIWAAGGIGPGRIDVMRRAAGHKTSLFGRVQNRPAATGFVAIHDRIAMIHALEVLARNRGQGLGRHLTCKAAIWALAHGATHISALCTKANTAANRLYASLGLRLVGKYHYRKLLKVDR